MRVTVGLAACSLFLTPGLVIGQALKFDVASVKVRPPGSLIMAVGGAPSGPRLNLQAMSLSDLVAWAYDVKIWQVTGGPVWVSISLDRAVLDTTVKRFDINAMGSVRGRSSGRCCGRCSMSDFIW
jgi:hypothetical protein